VIDVRSVVYGVPDPELPHVSIGDLGMVRRVVVDGTQVSVTIAPTFLGCPATEQIQSDVEAAVRGAGYTPSVEWELAPMWTSDDITEEGRTKLRMAGIAPPPAGGAVSVDLPVVCPLCGSRRTRLTAGFGATPCKALHHCDHCRQPFEAVKGLPR